jgi:hypothetical protein
VNRPQELCELAVDRYHTTAASGPLDQVHRDQELGTGRRLRLA